LSYTLIEGLQCQSFMQGTGLALLEVEKKVLKPVMVGDTIHGEIEVLSIKPTSKGNRAVVATLNDVVNQHGEKVISYKAVRMLAGRS
jgi:acyl dehydratase